MSDPLGRGITNPVMHYADKRPDGFIRKGELISIGYQSPYDDPRDRVINRIAAKDFYLSNLIDSIRTLGETSETSDQYGMVEWEEIMSMLHSEGYVTVPDIINDVLIDSYGSVTHETYLNPEGENHRDNLFTQLSLSLESPS